MNLSCPVCRRRPREAECGRLVFGSVACPVCLETKSPFVALPCGHALCQQDFFALGGAIADDAALLHPTEPVPQPPAHQPAPRLAPPPHQPAPRLAPALRQRQMEGLRGVWILCPTEGARTVTVDSEGAEGALSSSTEPAPPSSKSAVGAVPPLKRFGDE